MITLTISQTSIEEKKYVFSELLTTLGVAYELIVSKDPSHEHHELTLPNSKKIILHDTFFSKQKTSYLKKEALPKQVKKINHTEFKLQNIPILYGESKCEFYEDKVIIHADIIASTFFMLSRWEEIVNPSRDKHNRFPASESIAYKFDFLGRPIVEDYCHILEVALNNLGMKTKRASEYQLRMSHDVDSIKKWSLISILANIKNARLNLRDLPQIFNPKNDPHNNLGYMMKTLDKHGVKSIFYFIIGSTCKRDPKIKFPGKQLSKWIQTVHQKGHQVGFHPSYNSYDNQEIWESEWRKFSEEIPYTAKEARQHYLRASIPTTWQIQNEAGLKVDATMGYADHIGFRCGTSREFKVFDVLNQKVLDLKERPLIIMDTTLQNYMKLSTEEMKTRITTLNNTCREYAIPFTVLIHNFNLETESQKNVFEYILGLFKRTGGPS